MKKRMTFSLIAGVLLSAVALYLAFRNVPFTEFVQYIKSINFLWTVPVMAIAFLSYVFRVYRWAYILSSIRKITFWEAFHPLMIGFMINCVLPGRVGEFARPAILQKKDNIPFSAGLATIVVERVFDVIFLVGLFAAVSSVVIINPDTEITFGNHHLNSETLDALSGGLMKLGILLIAGIIVLSVDKTRAISSRIIMRIPSLFSFNSSAREKIMDKVCRSLVNFMENLASGFALIKNFRKVSVCVIFSFIVWILMACSYYVLTFGCPGIDLSLTEITLVMLIVIIFISLPSVPGFWGLWEAGGVFALSLFGIPLNDAAGFTLVNHFIQVVPVIIIGFISAVVIGINIIQVSYGETPDSE
ncbi:MAG: flippase-like domain-containing protein [Candidatus Latescibacteria bacterium]|jgi:glycosyltransferase 2 family protein|nr:flippase-like domain-containing protein [Candidatus Latescibacterota bacterium]